MTKARSRSSRRHQGDDVNGEWYFYDEDMVKNFPALARFLFGTKNEYDEEHKGGSLTLFEKGGVLKFRLFDKTTKETGWGGSIDACNVFADVEAHLVASSIDWQEDKGDRRN